MAEIVRTDKNKSRPKYVLSAEYNLNINSQMGWEQLDGEDAQSKQHA